MVEKNTQQVVCMEYDSDPGSRICFRTWKRDISLLNLKR
jgi:hypothetical protein